MREGAKKRLIGAVVIVALAVIFVPMLFEPAPLDRLAPIQQSIPHAPTFEPGVRTETFLTPQDSVGAPDPSAPKVSQPLALPPPADAGAPVPARSESVPAAQTRPARAPAPEPAPPKPAEGTPQGGNKGAAAGSGGRGTGSWVIQVASIPNAAGASELEDKLKAGGFAAFVEKAEVNGRVTYRVKVGPETDRTRAEQTAARLREQHRVQPMIRNYP